MAGRQPRASARHPVINDFSGDGIMNYPPYSPCMSTILAERQRIQRTAELAT